jgi:hypothetical protein
MSPSGWIAVMLRVSATAEGSVIIIFVFLYLAEYLGNWKISSYESFIEKMPAIW